MKKLLILFCLSLLILSCEDKIKMSLEDIKGSSFSTIIETYYFENKTYSLIIRGNHNGIPYNNESEAGTYKISSNKIILNAYDENIEEYSGKFTMTKDKLEIKGDIYFRGSNN